MEIPMDLAQFNLPADEFFDRYIRPMVDSLKERLPSRGDWVVFRLSVHSYTQADIAMPTEDLQDSSNIT